MNDLTYISYKSQYHKGVWQHLTYRGTGIRLFSKRLFWSEAMKARRKGSEILKVLKEKEKKKHQHKIQYPVKLFSRDEEEIMTFSYKQKLRKFNANRSAQEELLKEFLRTDGK